MAARACERPEPGNPAHWASLTRDSPPRQVRHDPGWLDDPTPGGFFGRFLAQLAVPAAQLAADGQGGLHLVDLATGSAATFSPQSAGGQFVRQAGPVRLWDAVETAWDAWDGAGQPGPESFRMSIAPGRQVISCPGADGLTFHVT
jgi:hypothetical protein